MNYVIEDKTTDSQKAVSKPLFKIGVREKLREFTPELSRQFPQEEFVNTDLEALSDSARREIVGKNTYQVDTDDISAVLGNLHEQFESSQDDYEKAKIDVVRAAIAQVFTATPSIEDMSRDPSGATSWREFIERPSGTRENGSSTAPLLN